MLKMNKYRLVAILLMLIFLACAVPVSAQDDDDDNSLSRFSRVLSMFTNSFYHSGDVTHEHQYNFYNGVAGLVAAGKGDLGGTHQGWSVEPDSGSTRYPFAANVQNYFASTAPNALPGQYMRIVGGFSMLSSHSTQSGVEPSPGSTGYVKDTVAVSSGNGGYFEHSSQVGTDDGRTRVRSAVDEFSSTNVDVQGTSMYYEKTVVDGGGNKTGWWDMELQ